MDVVREGRHLVVVGDIEHSMLGHLGAQRPGVGDGLLQSVVVAVGQKARHLCAASRNAVARPMPLAAPVTKHRLPA